MSPTIPLAPAPDAFRVDAGDAGVLTVLERGDDERPARFLMKLPAGYGHPVVQVHHDATEHITILSGRLEETIDGVVHALGPGDEAFIPKGAWHRSSVVGDEPVEMVVVLTPGLHAEDMFGRLFTAKQGTHGLLQKLAMVNVLVQYPSVVRFRWPVLMAFRLMATVLRRAGVLSAAPPLAAEPVSPAAPVAPRAAS